MGMLEDDLDAAIWEASQLGRSLMRLMNRHAWWSRRTFGPDDKIGPVGPMKHLAEEALEAAEAVNDPVEYADCLLLLLDGIRRAGLTLEQVIEAGQGKMDINENRVWPEPKDGEPRNHVRDTDPEDERDLLAEKEQPE